MAGVPILGPAQNQQSAGVGARDTGMGPDAVGCMIGSLASFPDKKLPLVAEEGLVKGFPGSGGLLLQLVGAGGLRVVESIGVSPCRH